MSQPEKKKGEGGEEGEKRKSDMLLAWQKQLEIILHYGKIK